MTTDSKISIPCSELKKIWGIIEGVNLKDAILKDRKLNYNASVLIWQYIRFNKDYIRDYSIALKDEKLERKIFKFKWGISKMLDPKTEIPPSSFYLEFRPIVVKDISDFKKKSETVETIQSFLKINKWRAKTGGTGKVLLVHINEGFKIEDLLSELKLEKSPTKDKKFKLKPLKKNVISHLVHYKKSIYKLKESEAVEMYSEVTGYDITQYDEIRRLKETFLEISKKAPYIFFQKQA